MTGKVIFLQPEQGIQSTLDALPSEPEAVVLRLAPGIYAERVQITRPHVTLEGTGSPEQTVITGNLGAAEILEDGLKRGTFRTQTLFVHAPDVTLRNLTVENTAGPGHLAGQAIALYADADRFLAENVRLLGHQDTLFAGPLPEKEVEPGGFRGPLEHAPRINGYQHYHRCFISGNVDFIFGSGSVWFEECEIFARNPLAESCPDDSSVPDAVGENVSGGNGWDGKQPLGYIAAPSTPAGQRTGFVFDRCILRSDCPAGSVYLGRPWRENGKAVFLNCRMEEHIRPEGWDAWGKPQVKNTGFLAEAGSFGPGGRMDQRASFAHILSAEQEEKIRTELSDGAFR